MKSPRCPLLHFTRISYKFCNNNTLCSESVHAFKSWLQDIKTIKLYYTDIITCSVKCITLICLSLLKIPNNLWSNITFLILLPTR